MCILPHSPPEKHASHMVRVPPEKALTIEWTLAQCSEDLPESLSTLKIMRADWFEWDYWSRIHSWSATLRLLLLFLLPLKMNFPGLYSVGKRLFFVWQCYEDFFFANTGPFFFPRRHRTTLKKIRSNGMSLPPRAWHLARPKSWKERTRKVKNIAVKLFVPRPFIGWGRTCSQRRSLKCYNSWALRARCSLILF